MGDLKILYDIDIHQSNSKTILKFKKKWMKFHSIFFSFV
jgi:hypothetical protein